MEESKDPLVPDIDEDDDEDEDDEEFDAIVEPILHRDESVVIDTAFFAQFQVHELTHFLLHSGILSNASFVTCLQKQTILKESKLRMYDEQQKQAQEKFA